MKRIAALLVAGVLLAGCQPASEHKDYRPATDREKLEHKIKQHRDCEQVCPYPSVLESDGGWAS